jgi:hypothetical protein
MIWLTWRQHRIEGLVTLAALAASGVFLLITGLSMAHTIQGSGLSACLASHQHASALQDAQYLWRRPDAHACLRQAQ